MVFFRLDSPAEGASALALAHLISCTHVVMYGQTQMTYTVSEPPTPPPQPFWRKLPCRFEILLTAVRDWKVSRLCGSLGKMAKGVDIGAHGNCVFCVSRLGASPSLLSGVVVLMFALAFLLSGSSFISHVSQPSADMKFETVLEALSVSAGETESSGQFFLGL